MWGFQHGGNPFEAAKYVEMAQQLDTADRYVNCKCAKYMLRAGMVSQAEQMCAKFTRVRFLLRFTISPMKR